MALWKRKKDESPLHSAPGTFKERVEEFWAWYATVASRFLDTINAGKCGELQPETSAVVDRLFPGFDWVFGPGAADKGGHSFTLSGNGYLHRQFLTEYWAAHAPELPGWTFYPSRQPDKVEDSCAIEVDGVSFKFGEIWITPELDDEKEKIHVTAWHPRFEEVPDKKMMVLFLSLDEALGEYGTDASIGAIEIGDERLARAFPLSELREFVERTEAEKGWKRLPPTESATVYQPKSPSTAYPRGDVFVGSTRDFKLIREYLEAEGQLDDPIGGTGAEFCYVAIDAAILPKGGEMDFRGAIEDALEQRLHPVGSGQVLGGATGTNHCYIDLLLFDGARSLATVMEVLREQRLPTGTALHFFAKGNEGRRMFL